MTTTQAHKSPPGASGLASASIRPNTRRADCDRGGSLIAGLLVASILGELCLLGYVVSRMVAR
jgi:hypothetical protein